MAKTKIEWAEHGWSPVTGCTPVSEGCRNCYARAMARRLAGRHGYPEAPHHFDVTLHSNRLDVLLKRKKPTMYFVCSMSDLFHKDVSISFLHRIFSVFARCKQHIFLVLTKRPERMAIFVTMWTEDVQFINCMPNDWVLPNLYLGVSVENQAMADERREYLRQCPAAVKFVSYEPALSAIDWTGWEFVSQIISGGESGPGARPSHPDWHRATRDFCQEHGIAYFFKQWGAWFPRSQWEGKPGLILPDDCYCKESPHLKIIDDDTLHKVGKHRAGRLLDGREHNELPSISPPRT